MNQVSDRLKGLVQSDIRRMSRECERVNGINLGQGICDLPTIPELVEGACDAIASSKATYSKFEGIDLLRERIARKMERFNGLRFDPMKEIVVTVGSTGGFATRARFWESFPASCRSVLPTGRSTSLHCGQHLARRRGESSSARPRIHAAK